MGKQTGRIPNLERFPELGAKLIELIETGCTTRYACDLLGLSEQVFYEWVQKGKRPGAKNCYADLAEGIKEARRKFVLHHLANIKRHSQQTWQASAWALERTAPKEFGSAEVQLRHRIDEIAKEFLALKELASVKGLKAQQVDISDLGGESDGE